MESIERSNQINPIWQFRFHHILILFEFIEFIRRHKRGIDVSSEEESRLVSKYVIERLGVYKFQYQQLINDKLMILELNEILHRIDISSFKRLVALLNLVYRNSYNYTLLSNPDLSENDFLECSAVLSFTILVLCGRKYLPKDHYPIDQIAANQMQASMYDLINFRHELELWRMRGNQLDPEDLISIFEIIFSSAQLKDGLPLLKEILRAPERRWDLIDAHLQSIDKSINYYLDFGLDSTELLKAHQNQSFLYYLQLFRALRACTRGYIEFSFAKDGICRKVSRKKSNTQFGRHCYQKVNSFEFEGLDTSVAFFLYSYSNSIATSDFDIERRIGSVYIPIENIFSGDVEEFLNES